MNYTYRDTFWFLTNLQPWFDFLKWMENSILRLSQSIFSFPMMSSTLYIFTNIRTVQYYTKSSLFSSPGNILHFEGWRFSQEIHEISMAINRKMTARWLWTRRIEVVLTVKWGSEPWERALLGHVEVVAVGTRGKFSREFLRLYINGYRYKMPFWLSLNRCGYSK